MLQPTASIIRFGVPPCRNGTYPRLTDRKQKNRRTQVPQGETSPGIVSACRVATRLQTAADGSLAQIIVILSVANGLQPPRDARIEASFLSSRENRVHHANFRYGTITHVCHTGFPLVRRKNAETGTSPDFGCPAVRDENSVNAELHPRVPDFDFCRASPDHREQAQPAGGPGGDRTHDLCVANAALSQLSYKPIQKDPAGLPFCHFPCAYCITFLCRLQVFFAISGAVVRSLRKTTDSGNADRGQPSASNIPFPFLLDKRRFLVYDKIVNREIFIPNSQTGALLCFQI